jgi:hypothetical protein
VRQAGALVVALASLAGCGVGGGGAFVGRWRPYDRVDYDACLVDDAGRCGEHRQVVTHVPARKVRGAIVTFPAAGVAVATRDGTTTTRARFEPSLEVLQGVGRVAVSVRVSGLFDLNGASSVPVIALGHLSLTERLSVHAGGGYVPYARSAGETSLVGGRALVGLQLALSRAVSVNYVVLSVDADETWIDFDHPYRAMGFTGHLGVYF